MNLYMRLKLQKMFFKNEKSHGDALWPVVFQALAFIHI